MRRKLILDLVAVNFQMHPHSLRVAQFVTLEVKCKENLTDNKEEVIYFLQANRFII